MGWNHQLDKASLFPREKKNLDNTLIRDPRNPSGANCRHRSIDASLRPKTQGKFHPGEINGWNTLEHNNGGGWFRWFSFKKTGDFQVNHVNFPGFFVLRPWGLLVIGKMVGVLLGMVPWITTTMKGIPKNSLLLKVAFRGVFHFGVLKQPSKGVTFFLLTWSLGSWDYAKIDQSNAMAILLSWLVVLFSRIISEDGTSSVTRLLSEGRWQMWQVELVILFRFISRDWYIYLHESIYI